MRINEKRDQGLLSGDIWSIDFASYLLAFEATYPVVLDSVGHALTQSLTLNQNTHARSPLGAMQKVCHSGNRFFDPPSPHVTHQKVTNSKSEN